MTSPTGGFGGGPIFMPGWGSALGNAANAAGQDIPSIINPNLQFQNQIKAALANPEMAQKLANMYATNPSVFNPQLYGQQNVQAIANMKPDPNYMFQQGVQKDAQTAYNSKPDVTDAVQSKALGIPDAASRTIQTNNATVSSNNATNSSDQLKARQAQVLLSQAAPEMQEQLLNDPKFVATLGMTPEQIIELKNHIHAYNSQQAVNGAADKWVAANPDALKNPGQVAKDILDGKIDTLTAGALQTDPKYASGINPAIEQEKHNRAVTEAAAALTQKTTGAADVASIRANSTVKAAQVKSTGDNFVKTFLNVTRQLDDKKNPMDPAQAMQFGPILQTQLNQTWAAAGQDGMAPIITATKTPHGFLGFGGGKVIIQYMDKNGKPLTITDPTQLLPPQTTGAAAAAPAATVVDPKVTSTVQAINSGTIKLQDFLNDPRPTPQQKQAVQAALSKSSTGNQ